MVRRLSLNCCQQSTDDRRYFTTMTVSAFV